MGNKVSKINVMSDQNKDGGFSHYVTFGDEAPWLIPSCNVVKMETEEEAHKLKTLIENLIHDTKGG